MHGSVQYKKIIQFYKKAQYQLSVYVIRVVLIDASMILDTDDIRIFSDDNRKYRTNGVIHAVCEMRNEM